MGAFANKRKKKEGNDGRGLEGAKKNPGIGKTGLGEKKRNFFPGGT